ncbi:MAG: helix-turn-helix transcriptional regulator [Mesorhizobium sp.]|nr:MAG: helix-turn-helix transcriptional regulator [Mesorhizobium sp.]
MSEGWLLTGEGGETTRVPLMGYVGAGAEVEPDFEQVPEDGMEEIEVPFPLPADMIAFQVKGDSMLPMFEDGMIIIVFREQRKGIDNFFGQRVIVRTVEGKRFVKTLMRGSAEGRVSLLSWNANPIENVEIVWIGEIFTYFPGSSVKHVANKVRRQGGIQGQLRRA